MKAIRNISRHIPGAFMACLFGAILMMVRSCEPDNRQMIFQLDDLDNITQFLEDNKDEYSRFYEIMTIGDLENALSAYNPNGNGFTLFLPTDEAFDRFIENSDDYTTFGDLIADLDFTRLLGRYHLVNTSVNTNDFPYGALPDTTASGDLLTIGFNSNLDSTVFKVNNVAPIVIPNLEMVNGFIHVISEVLEPVQYTGYEWLQNDPGYSIISEAFNITGLKDTMGIYRLSANNTVIDNKYTLLVEHDSIFKKYGINDANELIATYATPGLEYTNPENGLYQFAAYHMLEGNYFLDEFSGIQNYNTYASYPILISSGIDIRINPGSDTFAIEIQDADTTVINYIRMYYQESNILTKNGPIHILTDVMELYKPSRSERTFQFLEEPAINDASKEAGTYEFIDSDGFEVLHWSGIEKIEYVKSSNTIPANRNDYIEVEGDFIIEYTVPKILPGKYEVQVRADAFSNQNATIQVYLDGKRIGSNIDLSSGGNANNPLQSIPVGTIDFGSYDGHMVKIRSLIPGKFIWDFVRFAPV